MLVCERACARTIEKTTEKWEKSKIKNRIVRPLELVPDQRPIHSLAVRALILISSQFVNNCSVISLANFRRNISSKGPNEWQQFRRNLNVMRCVEPATLVLVRVSSCHVEFSRTMQSLCRRLRNVNPRCPPVRQSEWVVCSSPGLHLVLGRSLPPCETIHVRHP